MHAINWTEAEFHAMADEEERLNQLMDDDPANPPCSNPGGHEWGYSGTAYGGDDESYFGEGRCYCVHCGMDGDA